MNPTERAVVGVLLSHPDTIAEHYLTPEHFADAALGRLYGSMLKRYRANEGTDLISMSTWVPSLGEAAALYPDISEMMRLADEGRHKTLMGQWVAQLRQLYIERQMVQIGQELREGEHSDPGTLIQRLYELASAEGATGPRMLVDATSDFLDGVDEARAGGGDLPIPTGLTSLDRMLNGGVWRKELTLIGGRPGMGKTALAVQIAEHATLPQPDQPDGLSALLFSTEMSTDKLTGRILSEWCSIQSRRLQRKECLDDDEVDRIRREQARMANVRLAIEDQSTPTFGQIEAICRRHKLKYGLDLVVVDYFQILGHTADRNGNTLASMNTMANGFMRLAKQLDVAVVLLSQLNRNVESRANKRALKSDLKSCGALEEAAHVILFPYRPVVDDPEGADPTEAEIHIAKQRSGPLGTVGCAFVPDRVRFTNIDDIADTFGI